MILAFTAFAQEEGQDQQQDGEYWKLTDPNTGSSLTQKTDSDGAMHFHLDLTEGPLNLFSTATSICFDADKDFNVKRGDTAYAVQFQCEDIICDSADQFDAKLLESQALDSEDDVVTWFGANLRFMDHHTKDMSHYYDHDSSSSKKDNVLEFVFKSTKDSKKSGEDKKPKNPNMRCYLNFDGDFHETLLYDQILLGEPEGDWVRVDTGSQGQQSDSEQQQSETQTSQDTLTAVEEPVENPEAAVEDAAQTTEESVTQDAEGTVGETEQVTEDAAQNAEDAAQDAAQTTEDATQDAAQATEDAAQTTEDAAETTGDVAQDAAQTTEDAAESTESAAQDAAQTTEDASQATGDVAQDATQTTGDVAQDAAAETTETTNDVVEGTESIVDDVGDVIGFVSP